MIGIIYATVLITQHVKITLLLLKAVYCVQLFKGGSEAKEQRRTNIQQPKIKRAWLAYLK